MKKKKKKPPAASALLSVSVDLPAPGVSVLLRPAPAPSRDVMSRSPHAAGCRQPRPRRQGGLGSRPRALSGRASHALTFRSQNRRDLHDLHDLHGAQRGGAPWNPVWPPPGGRPGFHFPSPRLVCVLLCMAPGTSSIWSDLSLPANHKALGAGKPGDCPPTESGGALRTQQEPGPGGQ